MTLHDYLTSLRRHWVVIVLLTILGGAAGFGYAQTQTDMYSSTSSVMVIPARGDSTSELVQGANYVQTLVQTYIVVATSPQVLQPVIDDLDLDMTPQALAGTMTVDSPLNTAVLDIQVLNADPELARDIANATADELANAVSDLSPQNADNQPAVRVRTISSAQVPSYAVLPNTRLVTIMGALVGLALGFAYALLRRLFATRVTSNADIADITETPVLGDIIASSNGRTVPATIRTDPTGSVAESMRSFVAGLRFANVDGDTRVLLVTSSESGEGKSSISVATALIMAEQGSTVLLIDADLRRSSVGELTQLESSVGLTTVLLGDVRLETAVQPWASTGVDILTSGVLPPNPGQLLTSERVGEIVADVREKYDYVIIDSPPMLAVSDPRWLAPVADGVVVLARARKTRRDALTRTLAALNSTRTPVLGIVLNGVKREANNPYYATEPKRSRRSLGRRRPEPEKDSKPSGE
ncbi:polysaccharide biosynthesis tyrosine autokinase [Microbacterium sp.]|uniref:polysaccharide biosynthesis tyrosine autokinase n=1 Tax=Microbacterium sp. TaxID=51671 RepID=UPI003F71A415